MLPTARLLSVAGSEMAVSFATQAVVSGLSNPTTLQFGPDGRLYVAQQDGLIKVYNVTQPVPGQWSAVQAETLSLIKNLPNHNDNGLLNTAITDRQVTGLLVTGTAANPVIYVTSSDPRIGNFGDLNLDTNSGILSKLTWNGTSWTKVDLIRGLPRSEENHSPNGMVLSADGTKLYLTQGGNTNNGAPSHFFSNTPEYALAAAMLEIDLVALEAIPNKTFTYAPGVTSTYKYDLPTLDDPTVSNNGAAGNETAGGLDVGGPFGGNDGLNQAILPADAPLRIFATGLRNAYDVVLTQSGKLFTIDNGGNQYLGGVPILDANGKPTNQFNNGGVGQPRFSLPAGRRRLLRPSRSDARQPDRRHPVLWRRVPAAGPCHHSQCRGGGADRPADRAWFRDRPLQVHVLRRAARPGGPVHAPASSRWRSSARRPTG